MDFLLKIELGVGPSFCQYVLIWKFLLLHCVQNIGYYWVVYLIYVPGVLNHSSAPKWSLRVLAKIFWCLSVGSTALVPLGSLK